MWLFNCSDRLNALLHTWHLYGFRPLWILQCLSRCTACVNRLLQRLHSNGFSPEWIRLCILNAVLPGKLFPHSLHLYLHVWTFLCWYRAWRAEKRFSHWLHAYTFSPVCLFLWSIKYDFVVNCLLHTIHTYSIGSSSCRCSVISLLSASVFTSINRPVYAQHDKY